jgi:peptidoglycan glycosyltransferase
VSCNTAFANLGLDVGASKLREQAQLFGFDQRHLADLRGVASQFPDKLNESQLALSSIGQYDVAASPLQMAMVSSAIANDGVLMDPYVVRQVLSQDLKPIETHKAQKLSAAMTPEHAKELQQMMLQVVDQGTGRNAQIPGDDVGGKTGTAQSDPTRKPFAWFTSFAPVDNPAVAVAVIVEDADIPRSDIAGGRVAAPIARAVMQAAL